MLLDALNLHYSFISVEMYFFSGTVSWDVAAVDQSLVVDLDHAVDAVLVKEVGARTGEIGYYLFI